MSSFAKFRRIHDEQLHIASQGVGKQELIFSLMDEETLCLRWNDFHDIAQTSFKDLKNDKDFMDVTLACEDQSVQAHKVILSAGSPFFKRLLKIHTHPQLLVYLRGKTFVNLTAMVDFIYTAQCAVWVVCFPSNRTSRDIS